MRALAIAGSVALMTIGSLAFAQVEAEPSEETVLDKAEAADLARELAVEAAAVDVGSESTPTEAEAELQKHLDDFAVLASRLEGDIRGGAAKEQTRTTYRELRRVRLEALGLAMSGKVAISPEDAQMFEELITELGRYHAKESP